MQSTVFNFSFNLRVQDREEYIADTKMNNIVVDFLVAKMGKLFNDYGFTSHTREDNNDTVDTTDMYAYFNAMPDQKQRAYIWGIFGYENLFSLDVASGFNYSPKFLMRGYNYIGIARMMGYWNRGFLGYRTMFLVRGYKYKKMMAERAEVTIMAGHLYAKIFYTKGINIYKFQPVDSFKESNRETRLLLEFNLTRMTGIQLLKYIENNIRYEHPKWCEKIFVLQPYYFNVNVSVEGKTAFSGAYLGGFNISINLNEKLQLANCVSNYAIITINKTISLDKIVTNLSRLIFNKGL